MDNNLNYKSRIIKALEKSFIFVDDSEIDGADLSNYIDDSIQFMSFIVNLEEVFEIEIPIELMLLDNFISMEAICSTISALKYNDIL